MDDIYASIFFVKYSGKTCYPFFNFSCRKFCDWRIHHKGGFFGLNDNVRRILRRTVCGDDAQKFHVYK